ncbi:MAG: hemerythrin domain-containing protein [Deltaproteobacteria bacterium]|nr:hemerythrin domain-containing protein [Deltaproteobacteria bacterium]
MSASLLESIHHQHVRLLDKLAETSAVVRSVRDDGILDPVRWREVYRFIHEVALPHLNHEEAELFPVVVSMGLPAEALEFLKRDHENLRFLAKRAEASGLTAAADVLTIDTAEVVDRFVRAFDDHARREEELFGALNTLH